MLSLHGSNDLGVLFIQEIKYNIFIISLSAQFGVYKLDTYPLPQRLMFQVIFYKDKFLTRNTSRIVHTAQENETKIYHEITMKKYTNNLRTSDR